MKAKTSKTLGILLAVLLLMQSFAMTVLPAEAATGLVNGDFSQGTEGWTFPAVKPPATAAAELVTGDDGNSYASILKAGNQIYSPTIPVTAGERYAWTVDFNGNVQTRGWIYYLDSEGNKIQDRNGSYIAITYFNINNDWTTHMLLDTVPAFDDRTVVAMGIACNAFNFPANSFAYFDNVRVQKVDRNSDANLIANGDLEILQGGKPVGFAITGDGCTVETVNTYSGSTALKITRTTPGETKVSVKVPTIYDLENPVNYAVSAYMNLTEFTDDPANANDGVKLSLTSEANAAIGTTGVFTKTQYADGAAMGWRKMLCYMDYIRGNVYDMNVTFNGVGTVYIDNFYCGVDLGGVRNGDFEGFQTDYKPTAWSLSAEKAWGENGNFVVLREGNTDNHYLRVVTNSGLAGASNTITGMENGKRYKMVVDVKGGSWDCAPYVQNAGFPEYKRTGVTPNGGKDWVRDYSVYATYVAVAGKIPTMVLADRNGAGDPESGVYASFDNARMLLADDADALTLTETDEKVTAVFTGMGEDYTAEENYRKAKVVIARYLVTGNIFSGTKKQLDNVTIVEGAAAKLALKDQEVCEVTKFGEIPMTVTAEFEKEDAPSGASYEYKAFAVNASNRLLPLVKAADLFN